MPTHEDSVSGDGEPPEQPGAARIRQGIALDSELEEPSLPTLHLCGGLIVPYRVRGSGDRPSDTRSEEMPAG